MVTVSDLRSKYNLKTYGDPIGALAFDPNVKSHHGRLYWKTGYFLRKYRVNSTNLGELALQPKYRNNWNVKHLEKLEDWCVRVSDQYSRWRRFLDPTEHSNSNERKKLADTYLSLLQLLTLWRGLDVNGHHQPSPLDPVLTADFKQCPDLLFSASIFLCILWTDRICFRSPQMEESFFRAFQAPHPTKALLDTLKTRDDFWSMFRCHWDYVPQRVKDHHFEPVEKFGSGDCQWNKAKLLSLLGG